MGHLAGLNFIYTQLNRVIRQQDLDIIYICGPGHGGPAMVANTWLEGSFTERYPEVTLDEQGMARLFRQFSFPGGIPSHAAPDVPGSIHEGGELGYALSHAFGAALDNPDLLVACVVGDVEAETAPRSWMAELKPEDTLLSQDGRVLEILSEHTCQGWLEGYLLTGRHGLFSCYEAFIHIVDAMFNQHAKWLDACSELPWRADVPSLNYLLTSHVWRQDHNGFSHQDPGFIDVALNKKTSIVRAYLPPDANILLCVTVHILGTRNRINIVVAGKQPGPQWLSPQAAEAHCRAGLGRWGWASNDDGDPDVVLACAGDVPTLETLAAVGLLREALPALRIRVVNVVDLMTLMPEDVHPHGLTDTAFNALFTTNRPVVFAYHGYPWTIHRLTYRRANHNNMHVRGYREEGTTTTPFDMTVLNDLDRFHLVCDVLKYVPGLREESGGLYRSMQDKLAEHQHYIRQHGDDLPEVLDWHWQTRWMAD